MLWIGFGISQNAHTNLSSLSLSVAFGDCQKYRFKLTQIRECWNICFGKNHRQRTTMNVFETVTY